MQVDIFKYYLLNTSWSQFNLTEETICFYTFINEVSKITHTRHDDKGILTAWRECLGIHLFFIH